METSVQDRCLLRASVSISNFVLCLQTHLLRLSLPTLFLCEALGLLQQTGSPCTYNAPSVLPGAQEACESQLSGFLLG